MRHVVVTAIALTLVSAIVSGQAAAPQTATRDTLLAADREFCKTTAAKGLAGWLSFLAPDAAIFPQDQGIVTGLEAIKAYYARTGFDPAGLTWIPVAADIAASGDLGYTYGTWKATKTATDGKVEVYTGKYFTTWKKQPDGSWKAVTDIGNSDRPTKK
jgi:ketosteroid isomerase-like protein